MAAGRGSPARGRRAIMLRRDREMAWGNDAAAAAARSRSYHNCRMRFMPASVCMADRAADREVDLCACRADRLGDRRLDTGGGLGREVDGVREVVGPGYLRRLPDRDDERDFFHGPIGVVARDEFEHVATRAPRDADAG